ncbi:MAG TPA: hypothetical protein VLB86_05725 [Gaiellaceae bacterium]|nr:hypothetical protein [Gaiellaceae bacterium]
MHGPWLHDLESLEAISQDDSARRIFLRMSAMSQEGTIDTFLRVLAADPELDDDTKATLSELGRDQSFLLAVEDYCRRTYRVH